MKNKSLHRGERALALALMAIAMATVMACAGCSPKTNDTQQTSFVTASNVTLTAAQRPNIHFYTVEPSKFRKTIETTGAVDFDNDQATSVLAPAVTKSPTFDPTRTPTCWTPSLIGRRASIRKSARPWARWPQI